METSWAPTTAAATATASQGYYRGATSSGSKPGHILRGIAIPLTFVAAVLMGAAKQTLTVEDMVDFTAPVDFKLSIQSTDFSGLVYFVAINAIALVYTIVSLVLSIRQSSNAETLIAIGDITMAILIFTSNAAASTLCVLFDKKVEDGGFCSAFKTFCGEVKASIVFSMFAAFAYFLSILLVTLKPTK